MSYHPLSGWRINLLRLAYAPLVLGLAVFQLPLLAEIGTDRDIMHGIVVCMLSALCLLSIVGLFRPIAMLPLLMFEIAWKALWLVFVALPAWRAGPVPPAIAENLFAVALVVPIIALVPWDFVFRRLARSSRRKAQARTPKQPHSNTREGDRA